MRADRYRLLLEGGPSDSPAAVASGNGDVVDGMKLASGDVPLMLVRASALYEECPFGNGKVSTMDENNIGRAASLGSILPWLSREEIESEVDNMIHDELMVVERREAAIMELWGAAERTRKAVRKLIGQTIREVLDELEFPAGKAVRDLEQRVLELELRAYPDAKEPPSDFDSSRRE